MDQQTNKAALNPTNVERLSDRELAVTRLFDAPPRLVFKAWSDASLFRRWWMPASSGVNLVGCDMDVRTGGKYRLEFAAGDQTMAFFGKYLDVVPEQRIVWTNDEGEDDGAVTTVTFEDQGGKTLVTYHETYPSKEALEEAMSGSAAGLPEQFEQLAELLATAEA
ncbi:MAG: hypothetical protein QOD54_1049 [Sphingomonadales bacterium]|nr:hypothetical protein [Sphingomonadales bacterium]